jgi:hypothetical protein
MILHVNKQVLLQEGVFGDSVNFLKDRVINNTPTENFKYAANNAFPGIVKNDSGIVPNGNFVSGFDNVAGQRSLGQAAGQDYIPDQTPDHISANFEDAGNMIGQAAGLN